MPGRGGEGGVPAARAAELAPAAVAACTKVDDETLARGVGAKLPLPGLGGRAVQRYGMTRSLSRLSTPKKATALQLGWGKRAAAVRSRTRTRLTEPSIA